MYKKLLLTATAIAFLLTGTVGLAHATSYPLGGQTYYLAGAGVTSSATTIQLTYFETPDGTPITMSEFGTIGYGVIEPQTTANIEDISFTGVTQNTNGTATLTGVTRGVEFNYPYASNVNLEKFHAGGSQFIITNTAEFYYNEFAMQNNNNVFTWPTASSSVSTKGYTDYVGSGGANIIPASFIAQGVVQLGTSAQTASTTKTGSTGFAVVIPSQIATDTPTASCNSATTTPGAGCVPVASLNGQISSSFIPTVISSLGKNYSIITTTGTSSWAVPSGITQVAATVIGAGAPGGSCQAVQGESAGGSSGALAFGVFNVSATSSIQVFVGATSTATTSQASWSTFGTNGYFEKAFGGTPGTSIQSGSGAAIYSGVTGGTAQGGLLNLTGGTSSNGIIFLPTGDAQYLYINSNGGSTPLSYGQGGLSMYSAGGIGGINAIGFGAGGSGASCTGGSGNMQLGGLGTNGLVILNW